jgi:hypothetical protein
MKMKMKMKMSIPMKKHSSPNPSKYPLNVSFVALVDLNFVANAVQWLTVLVNIKCRIGTCADIRNSATKH